MRREISKMYMIKSSKILLYGKIPYHNWNDEYYVIASARIVYTS